MPSPAKRPVVPHPLNPSLALVQLTRGYWAVIDAAYSAEVARSNWSATVVSKTVYASTNFPEKISLHRFIARLSGMDISGLIDHRNCNGLDCRSSNLRPATKATNAQNRGLDRSNASGVKGVHFENYTGKWRAEVWAHGKHLRLGRFATLEEAAVVASAARTEHHGEFARLQ